MTVIDVPARNGACYGAFVVASGLTVMALAGASVAADVGAATWFLVGWATAGTMASSVDARSRRLPDHFVLPGLAIALVGGWSTGRLSEVILAGAVFGLPLLAVHLVDPDGMGYGDVKFASMLGAGIGLVAVPLVLPAYLLSATLHVAYCIATRAGRRPVPFGPALLFGSISVLVIALVGRS